MGRSSDERHGKLGWQHADRLQRCCFLAEAAGCLKPAGETSNKDSHFGSIDGESLIQQDVFTGSQQARQANSDAAQICLPECSSPTCLIHNPATACTAALQFEKDITRPTIAQVMRLCKAQSTNNQWRTAKSLYTQGAIHLMTAKHEQHPDTGETLLRVMAHIHIPPEARPTLEPCSCTGLDDVGIVAANVPQAMAAWACTPKTQNPGTSSEHPLYQQAAAGPSAPALTKTSYPASNNNIYERELQSQGVGSGRDAQSISAAAAQQVMQAQYGLSAGQVQKILDKKQEKIPDKTQQVTALPSDYVVELLVNPSSFAVLASAASCCDVGYDPLRNTPCTVVTATLLQLAAAPELVLCEHDLTNLAKQIQPHETALPCWAGLQDMENMAASSIVQNKHRLIQMLAAASGGRYEVNMQAMDAYDTQQSLLIPVHLRPTIPAIQERLLCSGCPNAFSKLLPEPSISIQWSRAMLAAAVIAASPSASTSTQAAFPVSQNLAGAGHTSTSDTPAVLAFGPWNVPDKCPAWLREDYACRVILERYRPNSMHIDGCDMSPKTLEDYMKTVQGKRNHMEGWAAAMHLLSGSEVAASIAPTTATGSKSDTAVQDAAMNSMLQALVGARQGRDGANASSQKADTIPECVLRVYDALATVHCLPQHALGPWEVSAAVSELMRIVWHALHRWELDPPLASKCTVIVKGIGRIMLTCHVPLPMRAAVAARLSLWQAKLAEALPRAFVPYQGHNGTAAEGLSNSVIHIRRQMLQVELAAKMGWDDPCITAALKADDDKQRAPAIRASQQAVASLVDIHDDNAVSMEFDGRVDVMRQQQQGRAGVVLQSPALIDIQGRLTWLDRAGLHMEYVFLACGVGQWSAAVRKLVLLGGREHISRATQLTVDLVSSPADKVALACGLVAAAMHQHSKLKVETDTEEQLQPGDILAVVASKINNTAEEDNSTSVVTAKAVLEKRGLTKEEYESARDQLVSQLTREDTAVPGVKELIAILFDAQPPKEETKQPGAKDTAAASALAALLEAAPQLPVTFITSCASAMFMSAAKTILNMPPNTSLASSDLLSLSDQGPTNCWLGSIRHVYGLLDRVTVPEQHLAQDIATGMDVDTSAATVPAADQPSLPTSTSYKDVILSAVQLLKYYNREEAFTFAKQMMTLAMDGKLRTGNVLEGVGDRTAAFGILFDRIAGFTTHRGSKTALDVTITSTAAYLGWNPGTASSYNLELQTGGWIEDKETRAALSKVYPITLKNTAPLQSLAACVVTSLLEQPRQQLLQGKLTKPPQLQRAVERCESLVEFVMDSYMPDRVQLQVVSEAMLVALMSVGAFCKHHVAQSNPVTGQKPSAVASELCNDLASQGRIPLASALARQGFVGKRTMEAAVQMLELALACSPEEELAAMNALFDFENSSSRPSHAGYDGVGYWEHLGIPYERPGVSDSDDEPYYHHDYGDVSEEDPFDDHHRNYEIEMDADEYAHEREDSDVEDDEHDDDDDDDSEEEAGVDHAEQLAVAVAAAMNRAAFDIPVQHQAHPDAIGQLMQELRANQVAAAQARPDALDQVIQRMRADQVATANAALEVQQQALLHHENANAPAAEGDANAIMQALLQTWQPQAQAEAPRQLLPGMPANQIATNAANHAQQQELLDYQNAGLPPAQGVVTAEIQALLRSFQTPAQQQALLHQLNANAPAEQRDANAIMQALLQSLLPQAEGHDEDAEGDEEEEEEEEENDVDNVNHMAAAVAALQAARAIVINHAGAVAPAGDQSHLDTLRRAYTGVSMRDIAAAAVAALDRNRQSMIDNSAPAAIDLTADSSDDEQPGTSLGNTSTATVPAVRPALGTSQANLGTGPVASSTTATPPSLAKDIPASEPAVTISTADVSASQVQQKGVDIVAGVDIQPTEVQASVEPMAGPSSMSDAGETAALEVDCKTLLSDLLVGGPDQGVNALAGILTSMHLHTVLKAIETLPTHAERHALRSAFETMQLLHMQVPESQPDQPSTKLPTTIIRHLSDMSARAQTGVSPTSIECLVSLLPSMIDNISEVLSDMVPQLQSLILGTMFTADNHPELVAPNPQPNSNPPTGDAGPSNMVRDSNEAVLAINTVSDTTPAPAPDHSMGVTVISDTAMNTNEAGLKPDTVEEASSSNPDSSTVQALITNTRTDNNEAGASHAADSQTAVRGSNEVGGPINAPVVHRAKRGNSEMGEPSNAGMEPMEGEPSERPAKRQCVEEPTQAKLNLTGEQTSTKSAEVAEAPPSPTHSTDTEGLINRTAEGRFIPVPFRNRRASPSVDADVTMGEVGSKAGPSGEPSTPEPPKHANQSPNGRASGSGGRPDRHTPERGQGRQASQQSGQPLHKSFAQLLDAIRVASKPKLDHIISGHQTCNLFCLAQYIKGRGAGADIVGLLVAAAARQLARDSSYAYGEIDTSVLQKQAACPSWLTFLESIHSSSSSPMTDNAMNSTMEPVLYFKCLPAATWAEYLAAYKEDDPLNVSGSQRRSHNNRLELYVAWVDAVYDEESQPADGIMVDNVATDGGERERSDKAKVLLAMAKTVETFHGCGILHLAYALLRCHDDEAFRKGVTLINQATFPAIIRYSDLASRNSVTPPAFTTKMYKELCTRVAVLLAGYVSGGQGNCPVAVEKLHEPTCNLARTMVFLRVPFPPELLSCPVAVRSAMSLFNELVFKRMNAADLDLFSPKIAGPDYYSPPMRLWVPQTFQKVVMGPLRDSEEDIQAQFMAAALNMPDTELEFKLKVPLFEWVKGSSLHAATLFSAATKALKDTIATMTRNGSKKLILKLKPGTLSGLSALAANQKLATTPSFQQGAGSSQQQISSAIETSMESWLADKQASVQLWEQRQVAAVYLGQNTVPFPGSPSTSTTSSSNTQYQTSTPSANSNSHGQRKWIEYIVKWLSSQLVASTNDMPVNLLASRSVPSARAALGGGPTPQTGQETAAAAAVDAAITVFSLNPSLTLDNSAPASIQAVQKVLEVLPTCQQAGLQATSGDRQHPLQLIKLLQDAVEGFDGPQLIHVALAALNVLDVYIKALKALGISVEPGNTGSSTQESSTVKDGFAVQGQPLALIIALALMPELDQVKTESPEAVSETGKVTVESISSHSATSCNPDQAAMDVDVTVSGSTTPGGQSATAVSSITTAGSQLGLLPDKAADAWQSICSMAQSKSSSIKAALANIHSFAVDMLRRAVLPNAGSWQTLMECDTWKSSEYTGALSRLLGSHVCPTDKPCAICGNAATSSNTNQHTAASQGKLQTFQHPLPPNMWLKIIRTQLQNIKDLPALLPLLLAGCYKQCCATSEHVEVHVSLSLKDAIALQNDPVCNTLRGYGSASVPSPFKKDLIMMLRIPTVLIPDIQSLQLRIMNGINQAFYFRQIQLQLAQPAVFQNLRTNHTIEPSSLIQVVQPIPGMPLQDFAQVCQSLLSAIQSDLGPESQQADTLSPGMIAVLSAAAPLPEIPASRTMTAQQVNKLWAIRIAGRSFMMKDKALPPAVVRAALLVRLRAGLEQLIAIVNSHPTPIDLPNAPVPVPYDPGVAAAYTSACECVADDLHALFKVDVHACAMLLGIAARGLMGKGEHDTVYYPPQQVREDELVSVCSSKGGPSLTLEPALTCPGPMFPVNTMAQLRRLPTFTHRLGAHLRSTQSFLKVYRVFSPSTATLPNKLSRFLSRNPTLNVEALANKIAKDYTIAAIDELKSNHLPWPPTVTTGTKLNRARELAEFILDNRKDYRGY